MHEAVMDASLLILLLLVSSQYAIHPTIGANSGKSESKKTSTRNALSPSSDSIEDVLAQTGGVAMLPCRFTGRGIVNWIRQRDRQLLTIGRSTHSTDTRFHVISNSPDWTLYIKTVTHDDAGLYECQIQTDPVKQRFVRLNITEAYSVIPGGPDLHVKQGSSLRLECQLMAATESPSYIFWFREGRMINYDDEPGVKVEPTKNGSTLIVNKVKLSHGANYTCTPSNANSSYIMIHVIEEEEKPAAMHGGERRNSSSILTTDIALILCVLIGQFRRQFHELFSYTT